MQNQSICQNLKYPRKEYLKKHQKIRRHTDLPLTKNQANKKLLPPKTQTETKSYTISFSKACVIEISNLE